LRELMTQVVDAHQVQVENAYPNLGIYSFGRGLFVKPPIPGVSTSAKTLYRTKQGQFIYSRLFAFEGAYGLVSKEFDGRFVSNEYPMFACNRERVLPEFLAMYFRRPVVWRQVAQLSTGLGDRRTRVQPEQLLAHSMPLPPLAEQRRLVALIDAVAARVEEAKRLREQAADAMDVLEGSLVGSVLAKEDWPRSTLESLVGQTNLRNGKSPRGSGLPSPLRCLTLSSIRNGVIDCRLAKYVDIEEQEASPYLVRPQDVFIVRGNGSKNLVGRAGMVSDCPSGVIFPDLFIRVPLPSDVLLPEYFVAVWNSPQTRKGVERQAQTTSGIWKINQGHIAATNIPVPPLNAQRRIAEQLHEQHRLVADLRSMQTRTALELNAMLPSILNRAFTGCL
jgi:type I restriction enzyme S subunit